MREAEHFTQYARSQHLKRSGRRRLNFRQPGLAIRHRQRKLLEMSDPVRRRVAVCGKQEWSRTDPEEIEDTGDGFLGSLPKRLGLNDTNLVARKKTKKRCQLPIVETNAVVN